MSQTQLLFILSSLWLCKDTYGSSPWDYTIDFQEELQQTAVKISDGSKMRLDRKTQTETARIAKKIHPGKWPEMPRIQTSTDLFPAFINMLFLDYESLRQMPWNNFRLHFIDHQTPFDNEVCLEIYITSLLHLKYLSIEEVALPAEYNTPFTMTSGTYYMTPGSRLEQAYLSYKSSSEPSEPDPRVREPLPELSDTRTSKKRRNSKILTPN